MCFTPFHEVHKNNPPIFHMSKVECFSNVRFTCKIKNTDSESVRWGFNVLCSFCKHDFMASCFKMSLEAKYFALNFKVVSPHGKKEIKKELMNQAFVEWGAKDRWRGRKL